MGFLKWIKSKLKQSNAPERRILKRQDSVKSGEIDPMFQA